MIMCNYKGITMMMRGAGIVMAVLFSVGLVCAETRRSFKNYEVWPDDQGVHINAHGGGVLFHEGRYYWFGEHKVAGDAGNQAQVGVSCYSSADLYNWKNEGIALKVVETAGHDIEKGCILERPKVIFCKKTGKFALFFHLELKGQGYRAARTGIAVADRVTGPYTYVRSVRPTAMKWPVNHATNDVSEASKHLRRDFAVGQMSRDMTLFVDDDAKAYHIFASEENRTLHLCALTDDYLDYTGKYLRLRVECSTEAPALCKYQGRYYLIGSGCTGWNPNPAHSAVATSIWGPWKDTGNPTRGINPFNQKGPEVTFGGQSTFILPVHGKPDLFIAMFDIWRPKDAIDGRYVWLPITFTPEGQFEIHWQSEWTLDAPFKQIKPGVK